MPGKNALYDPSERPWYDRIIMGNVHLYTIFVVLLVEVMGIVRFYLIYEDLRYTFECFAIVMFLVSADFVCFSGMLKAKYADPGYLIPKN